MITILPRHSADIVIGRDVRTTPDIIFTETIDCGVTNEGFYAIARDIKRLAGPNTSILPQELQQFGYFVECEDLYNLNNVGFVGGFDLSDLNRFSTRNYFPVHVSLFRPRVITATILLRQYRYLPESSPHPTTFQFVAELDALCHGMVSYFDAKFGRYTITNDLRTHSHWHQAFHPLIKPLRLRSGNTYTVTLEADGRLTLKESSDA